MKSSFGRSFYTGALILLLSLTMLGASYQGLVKDYLTDSAFARLERDAQAISHLASSYAAGAEGVEAGSLPNLNVAASLTDSDIIICNPKGRVISCSDSPFGCKHTRLTVNADYIEKVITSGADQATGIIQGLYDDARFLVSRPIEYDGTVLGIAIVSVPTASTNAVLKKLATFYLNTAMVVILISILGVFAYAGTSSRPLRDLAKAANAFGHGDLEARVRVEDSYSEETRDLAIAFNNMASSLQKSEYQRQEFVANVSHELKTPLQGIIGSAELLENGLVKQEDVPRFIGHIRSEAQRLVTLIGDIIRLSQLDEGEPMPAEPVELLALAREAAESLQSAAAARNVTITVEGEPVELTGVRRLLYEIVFNLCDNAIKYNTDGGRVQVTVTKENETAAVTVRDTGIGIPPDQQDRVFERFYRVDKSHSKASGGTGLGLSIVKHAVQYHHGAIHLQSEVGKGTEIRVTFPVA